MGMAPRTESTSRGAKPEVPAEQVAAEEAARENYIPGTMVERSPDMIYEDPGASSPRGAALPGTHDASADGGSNE